jgi:hypothetical protein
MKKVKFFLNCNAESVDAEVVSENNENNVNLILESGEQFTSVIRKENHNANELQFGNLSYFEE